MSLAAIFSHNNITQNEVYESSHNVDFNQIMQVK